MEFTTTPSIDHEDYLWLQREAKARGIRHEDLLRELINQLGVRVRPGSDAEIRQQLDAITHKAIKQARQGAIACDN